MGFETGKDEIIIRASFRLENCLGKFEGFIFVLLKKQLPSCASRHVRMFETKTKRADIGRKKLLAIPRFGFKNYQMPRKLFRTEFCNWKRANTTELWWKAPELPIWKNCLHMRRSTFNSQCIVFPATAVPGRDVESMRHHTLRRASFCPQQCPRDLLPANTWPNHLARTGYFFDERIQRIHCFACSHKYPSHADDCHRQSENIDDREDGKIDGHDEQLLSTATSDDDVGSASHANILFRTTSPSFQTALSDAGDEVESPSRASASSSGTFELGVHDLAAANLDLSAEGGTDMSPAGAPGRHSSDGVPKQIAVHQPSTSTTIAGNPGKHSMSSAKNFMCSLTDRRGSYSADWSGPSVSDMADCGLYQLSTNSAKCHCCLVVISGLTINTCIWSLHRNLAPHCQFLRSYREG